MASNEKEYDEKMFTEVQEMYKEIYPNKSVPNYEVNAYTVKTLHEVLTKLKLDQKIKKEKTKYYRSNAQLYAAKSEEMKETLESLQITMDKFPEECQKAIKSLATTASVLDLKEPTTTKFLLGMNHLEREVFDMSEEKRKFAEQTSKLIKKLDPVLQKIQVFQKDVDSLKASQENYSAENMKKQNTKASFLQAKKGEYIKTAKKLEDKLEESGYTPSINHSELEKKNAEKLRLQEKLKDVMKMLNSYSDLPPNEDLAKLKVEEARQELLAVEEEIDKILEDEMS